MRTGRLLGAGRTADVYELHADEGESGADGPDGLGTVTGTAAPGGAADRDGADSHTGPGGRDGRTERGGGAWVLRRYRDGWGDAAAEAEVMEYVRGHGYPVPRVRSATRTEMVLARRPGHRAGGRRHPEGPPGLDWAVSATILAQVKDSGLRPGPRSRSSPRPFLGRGELREKPHRTSGRQPTAGGEGA
ncbi:MULTISPECIES: hypothetical protein [Streptomyces]|uniref:hypothetical protein n=1 Tax=Streptomyces TaxID=1883 RepID=UPI001F17578F|nr:hypothetical protein [Streptomyces sp. AMCC400023]